MGKIVLLPSNFLGDSISALGFPAGGSIGFDKIWKVDAKGFTDSLSTCNCAIRKDAFEKIGGFDESFPFPGGEDSLLAYNLRNLNYRIKYCTNIVVYHAARDSFRGFFVTFGGDPKKDLSWLEYIFLEWGCESIPFCKQP